MQLINEGDSHVTPVQIPLPLPGSNKLEPCLPWDGTVPGLQSVPQFNTISVPKKKTCHFALTTVGVYVSNAYNTWYIRPKAFVPAL